jgi:hypothetical protein
MPCSPPRPAPGPLPRHVSFGLELIDQLIELIEINPVPEPECVWNGFGCRMPTRFRLLAETRAERTIDHFLEGQPELARAPLQEASQIVIDGECGAHGRHHKCAHI